MCSGQKLSSPERLGLETHFKPMPPAASRRHGLSKTTCATPTGAEGPQNAENLGSGFAAGLLHRFFLPEDKRVSKLADEAEH